MEATATVQGPKKIRIIAPANNIQKTTARTHQLRVVAYCRVSTEQEEQLNSYEVQKQAYTEKINSNPEWKLAGIYADKGITGTSVKKRDGFNDMIKFCKRGKVDMIIVKSISRFARNTMDCLKYTRWLKETQAWTCSSRSKEFIVLSSARNSISPSMGVLRKVSRRISAPT